MHGPMHDIRGNNRISVKTMWSRGQTTGSGYETEDITDYVTVMSAS